MRNSLVRMILINDILNIVKFLISYLFFERELIKEKKRLLGVLSAAVLVTVGLALLNIHLFSHYVIFFMLLFLTIHHNGSLLQVNHICLSFLVTFWSDYLFSDMVSMTKYDDHIHLLSLQSFAIELLFCGVCSFVLVIIIKWIYKYLLIKGVKEIYILTVSLTLITFEFMRHFWQQDLQNKNISSKFANMLVICFVVGVLLFAFRVYSKVIKDNMAIKAQQQLMEASQQYVRDLETSYQEMQKFRHDYKNILISLECYILEKNYEELENYYAKHIRQTGHLLDQHSRSLAGLENLRDLALKSIFAIKLLSLQELVQVKLSIEVIESVRVDPQHIITLVKALGIILDNATEELFDLGQGELNIAVIKQPESIVFIVKNSCRSSIEPLYDLKRAGFSTKGTGRGLGLANLAKEINQSENMVLETEVAEGYFTQIITVIVH